ncbi:hypothetical protein A8C32_16530 [Flavivirga aquatica]|uniref:DUF4291 domain-containing protein n=1 Tax=Flavivirga aquatica TaxID=1849968 RepID=A0A1E5T9J6_9FLAO|nr:DUF4291 domain-containing protein [Flavivirga aquatica]OEK08060.1 hypothetical protein A8C32_16530 [Flavivirga aquatica]
MKERVIRAEYDDQTITVYQAYRKEIAIPTIENQTFVSPFKTTRMTWIKPSFLWMMYRSGWAQKEGQEYILKIKIKREGFEWALQNSCLSHFTKDIYSSVEEWRTIKDNSPVRIQWDPERDLLLNPLNHRAIQIGLSGIAVEKYVNDWIVSIEDITAYSKKIHQLVINDNLEKAKSMLPIEETYFSNYTVNNIIGAT